MSDVVRPYPIEPGSALDLAINNLVEAVRTDTAPSPVAMAMLDMLNPVHMITLGFRVDENKPDLDEETFRLYWYGGAPDE